MQTKLATWINRSWRSDFVAMVVLINGGSFRDGRKSLISDGRHRRCRGLVNVAI